MKKHFPEEADSAESLLKACTYTAAKMIGEESLGNIRVGGYADLFVLRGDAEVPLSKLRALGDNVYHERIDELKQEYCE